MTDTRLLFDRVLTDEPPLALTLEPVVADGRRIKRRRRAMVATGALSVVSIALLAILPLGGTAGLQPTRPASSATTAPDGLTPAQRAIADAIVAASPAGWTFDFAPERWDGNVLDTTVDDGHGASWLHVYPDAKVVAGGCTDQPDQGGSLCVEKTPDGRFAALWMHVSDVDDRLRRLGAMYVSAEGVGLVLTTANYLRDPADPKRGTVTRAEPPYSEDDLHRLAAAVDEAYAPYL